MQYIEAEEILLIHHQLIERYGGSHGTRNLSRIESVVLAPSQHVYGDEQYKTIFEKAAVYARNIIADHPFYDGNKRTGITTTAMFLEKNGYCLKAKKGEIENFAVEIAISKLSINDIARWLETHTTKASER